MRILIFCQSLMFSILLVSWTKSWKPSVAYLCSITVHRKSWSGSVTVRHEHNLQLYLQVRLEWAWLFWSEWVQTTSIYRICLMRSEVSGDFWLVSGNVTAPRLAVVGKICIYSSVPDTVCDWLHFRSCGDVCGTLSLVMLPHERSLLEKCVWLCPPHEKVLLKG